MRAHEQSPGLVALGYPGPDPHDGGDGGDGGSLRGQVARLRRALSEATAAQVAGCVVDALKPELLRRGGSAVATAAATVKQPALGPTAWLDGLRGWAAFTVCFVHLAVYTHSRIELCYGAALDDDAAGGRLNATPAAWPFLRLFWSGGHFAVMVFFAISGYVLPGRLLALLHEGRRDAFVAALHSAVVRRALRLFLPVVWSTLALATVWHLTGVVTPWPPRQPTYLAELWSWLLETLKFVYFYRAKVLYTYYNIHTWTIPVELRGSLLLFVWLFVWHAFAQRLRLLATLAMTLYLAVAVAGAWYACFMAGMLTVELDMLAAAAEKPPRVPLPWDGARRALQRRPRLRALLLHLMLLAALWLGSEPSSDAAGKDQVLGTCPGWKTLSRLVPPAYTAYDEPDSTHRWFWLFWAAWLLLVAVKEIGWARRLFEMRFSQYLGRHSFALYLIHGPAIGMFSERLFYLTGVKKGPLSDDDIARYGHLVNKWHDSGWWIFSNDGPYGLEPNFLFCVAVSLPVFLYVAELGTRMFDAPSVRVSRWAYNRLKRTAL